MFDSKQFARELGRRMAKGAADASLAVEGSIMNGTIYPEPGRLAPLFRPLDPYQTWRDRETPRAIPTDIPESWSARRVWLPGIHDPKASAAVMLAELGGCPGTLCFDVVARKHEVHQYLVAQPDHIDLFAGAWQLQYAKGSVVPANDPLLELPALRVVMDLYGTASYDRLITTPASLWGHFCRIASLLGSDDFLLFQVLFSRVLDPWQQNIAVLSQGRRSGTAGKSLDEPLFAAAVRCASTNESVGVALASLPGLFTQAGMPFGYRTMAEFARVLSPEQLQGMLRSRCSFTMGQLMTSSELALFVHPPEPSSRGTLHFDVLKGLPVPERLQDTTGLFLGMNSDRGEAVPVFHPWKKYYNTHAAFPGTSGKGKSKFLENCILRLAEQGAGICYLDPHRRSAEHLVGALGSVRDRVVYLDFDSRDPIVAFNSFADAQPEDFTKLASNYLETLDPLFDMEGKQQIQHYLRNGFYALFVLGLNLAKLEVLFSSSTEGDVLRAELLKKVRHESVARFWREEYPKLGQKILPVYTRLHSLLFDETMHAVFSQETNKLKFADFMRDGKIVIAAMSSNWEVARISGGMIIGIIKHLAMERRVSDKQFFLVVDEFPRFTGSGFDQIINQTTKGRLSLWLAHQNFGQCPTELQTTIQTIDTFVFGISKAESRLYSALLGDQVSPETLMNLGTGDVYARIGSDIVNFHTPPPLKADESVAAEIIAASQAAYYAPAVPAAPVPALRRKRVITDFS